MTQESWVEPKARIPLTGIVAIVLIVAVVAIFLKTQLAQVLPPSTIQVSEAGQDLPTANTAGRASATFDGLREISLISRERYGATLITQGVATAFIVDDTARTLTIERDGSRTLLNLEPQADGILRGVTDLDGDRIRIDIDLSRWTLTYSSARENVPAVRIVLGTVITREGLFNFRSERLLFEVGGPTDARVLGAQIDAFTLTEETSGISRGTWLHDGTSYPVTVDFSRNVATIENVW